MTTSSVNINADYFKSVNYALFHNRIPVCQGVTITNTSDRPLEDVKLTCTGEFISQFQSPLIAVINPGESIRLSPFKIAPDAGKLASLTERVITDLRLTATSGEETVGETVCEIELMPYDLWTGTRLLPQTIASFITPNHPAINQLVVKSAEMLKLITGSSSLNEYQTGDSNDVRQQVAAVFAAIHDLGIVYRSMPASYETIGQRITMPDQVVASKIGNCIELTLLMATVLEAIGINSLIIFQQGHAYLGVWLVDDCFSCSVSDDPAFIEKKCSRGIDEMLVIECTQAAQENASFDRAVQTAERNLADHKKFEMFIDVKRSRLERIHPLPARVESDGGWSLQTSGVDHDTCTVEVREHDRYDLSRLTAGSRELTKFDIWERKLLDFSLRNSLLNLSLRRRAIQFISFEVNRIEDHLQAGREYRLTSKPNVEFPIDRSENLVRSKIHTTLRDLIHNDIEHGLLHTYLPEGETKWILRNIYRAARNTIEETGANSLFLAIGTLRWFETEKSSTPRYAPLLLLPVEMVYKKGSYYIRTRDEEISLNITLMEFLRQNHDITIKGLDPLPLDESGVDVPLIFAIIRDALKEQKRWDVEEEALLGTFSFSKFLMWSDIHNHRDQLQENPIISSLLANRLTWTPKPVASDLREIDRRLSPLDTALPMSVDSSQMAAVLEGGDGNSFILYGPPGTGKSQTITNLIANALYHGKRVLFVAEKMAALNVVQSRLEKIGLGPFCLELHSNKSTKRHVLEQLEKALKVVRIVAPPDHASQAEKIFLQRKDLIDYLQALHTPDPADGLSLYDCIVRHESIDAVTLPDFTYDKKLDSFIAKDGIKGIEEILGRRLETITGIVGHPSEHPLNGLHVDRKMATDAKSTEKRLVKDASTLSALLKEQDTLKGTKALLDRLMRDNSREILDEDPEALRQQWREANAKWFLPKIFAKRNFINRLRRYNRFISENEVNRLMDDLIVYRENHGKILAAQKILQQYFGLEYTPDEMPPESATEAAVVKLRNWSGHTSEMRDWFHWTEYCDDLREKGLGCVADALSSTPGADISSVKDSFLKAMFRHKVEEKISRSELLSTFEGLIFDEKTALYRQLTEEFQTLTQKELYARLAARVPRMADNPAAGSEIGLLNRNISNGGRGLSLRDLLDQIPTLLPRLCPCMLMSPMSVAQYIDLAADKFDLVIFDEASQMPTSEAVGAIARGKALIVVGDPKQMPPTSFFTSTNVDTEEAVIDDMESILEDCRTLDMPSLQLSWHYRSRHESLIAFSNNEYYDGSLITFPSVDDRKTKVHFRSVDGRYDKGGQRTNRKEAVAIVNEIVRRLRDERLRRHSIGVISFSIMQQGLIEDMLQERLDNDRELLEAAAAMYEPIFVKNLENVQGDERDVILFSIGYGPDKEGKVSMNFGPLNNVGGERRLNVAVSRARREMYVFSTLRAADIDLKRSKARGVEGLKHFLQYAETQSLPAASQSRKAHRPSLIAEQIAAELRNRGYNVATNVGRSQFRVDVAVGKGNRPDSFSLGIILDGETYRDTNTTRDREVVQPTVLNALGWDVMRVWSVDWFTHRERVMKRIVERLATDTVEEVTSAPVASGFEISPEEVVEETVKSNASDYITYSYEPDDPASPVQLIETEKASTPHSTSVSTKASMSDPISSVLQSNMTYGQIIHNIVATEQPINFTLLCRRMAALIGASRATQSLQRTVNGYAGEYYVDADGAWWLDSESSREYSFYRPNSGRDITEIPEIELINALKETLEEQIALTEDNLTLSASRKMGFSRRGANVDAAFRKAVASMKAAGLLESIPSSDMLRLK